MSKHRYQRIARLYDFLDKPFEFKRYQPLRGTMFEGLSGNLLDAGVGTVRNIPFYPADADVTGIDLSPAMLKRAKKRHAEVGSDATLLEMDALDCSFDDATFDGIVSTFMFCVLDYHQQLPALKELGRILKPGAELRLLEYSYSADPKRRFIMRLWAPWVHFAYGARFDRNTHEYVEQAGLELVDSRFVLMDVIRMIVVRKPA